jgi:replicative DNA helicase
MSLPSNPSTPPAQPPSDTRGGAHGYQGRSRRAADGKGNWSREGDLARSTGSQWDRPHSLEAERGVLGSALLDGSGEASDEVMAQIHDEHVFYDPRHQIIFNAMREIKAKAHPLDLLTLGQRLTDTGALETIGGHAYLSQMLQEVPTPRNIFSYLRIVKDKYLLRRVLDSCAEVVESVALNPDDPKPVLDEAESVFYRITEDTQAPELTPSGNLVMSVIQCIDKLSAQKGRIVGVPTGFKDFDGLTGGLRGGDMVVFAARPGVGKTSFALNIAEHAVLDARKPDDNSHYHIAFFSLEMPNEQLMLRLFAARARVNLRSLRAGILSQEEFAKIANAAGEFKEAKLYLDETPGLTLAQLRTKVRRGKKKFHLDMVIIDYLQLLQSGSGRHENRQSEVAEISGGIKALAKEMNIPIIVLCQLNRESEKRTSGTPRISDLRESGSIEQDADMVGLLYRPEMIKDENRESEGNESKAFLALEKHRNGPTGLVPLTFLKDLTRFIDLSKKSEENSQ